MPRDETDDVDLAPGELIPLDHSEAPQEDGFLSGHGALTLCDVCRQTCHDKWFVAFIFAATLLPVERARVRDLVNCGMLEMETIRAAESSVTAVVLYRQAERGLPARQAIPDCRKEIALACSMHSREGGEPSKLDRPGGQHRRRLDIEPLDETVDQFQSLPNGGTSVLHHPRHETCFPRRNATEHRLLCPTHTVRAGDPACGPTQNRSRPRMVP
ncbi:hypothetical protein MTE01_16400 [Microbacterium testaceum]|uniref:Uncharacterized protein n=1 Tax=Microbacterium testaceum TaxID=2033 RepID=A0A4Y3QKH8_MICTE|nr:hypothetical protein MTE01_16400 [Microbacterium testaceum]